MPEISLPPPSSETSYGADNTVATDNFSNDTFDNGQPVFGNNEPESNMVDSLITEVPFDRSHTGEHVDNVPENLKLNNKAEFNKIRDRFAHEGLLDSEELKAFQILSAQLADSAIQTMVPNASEFSGLFKSFSDKAVFYSTINSETGTNNISVTQVPELLGDIVNLDVHRMDREASVLGGTPEVDWRNPGDARLVSYIISFVHEHGHAVARKFAESSNPPGKYSNSFFASYLSAYPNEGYTGILGSDPNIYDERFAEGLSALTVEYVMANLGYSKSEQETALKTARLYDQEYSEGEHHQVEAVEHARQMGTSIGHAALELAGIDSDHLRYEGGLGYKKPLTASELGEVFYFAKEVTVDGVSSRRLNADTYRKAFDAQYGGNMHPDVEERLAKVRASKVA